MAGRTVFFLSDQTGVTAETLGHSLLTQFTGQDFRQVTLPFIDSDDKAHEAVVRINEAGETDSVRPIVFSTLVQDNLRAIVSLRLLPNKKGTSRVPAVEIMRSTRSIQECIKDPQRSSEITEFIARARSEGMQTFDQHLLDLLDSLLAPVG